MSAHIRPQPPAAASICAQQLVGRVAKVISRNGLREGSAILALHDDQGQRVHFKRDGIAVETGRSGGVTITVTNHAPCTVIADAVHLGGANLVPSLNGVVTGEAFDTFTGALQSALGNASTKVMAKKA